MNILFSIFAVLMIVFAIVIITQLKQIKRKVREIIMNQQEFDEKIDTANAALDSIGEAITAEAQQIADFIAGHPNLDTSALDGVVTRLQGVSASVANVFEPPTPETDNA